MEPVGHSEFAGQRLIRSYEYWDLGPAELDGEERVLSALCDSHISCNDGDRFNSHLSRSQCHNQGNSIIGSSVGINQD
jgi:hypothetical protein